MSEQENVLAQANEHGDGILGLLHMTVTEAILTHDTETFGNMDPYAQLIIGGNDKYETGVVEGGGKRPKFNQTFTHKVTDKTAMVKYSVFDKEMINDDLIGEGTTSLDDFISASGMSKLFHLKFEGNSAGKLYIKFDYVDFEKAREEEARRVAAKAAGEALAKKVAGFKLNQAQEAEEQLKEEQRQEEERKAKEEAEAKAAAEARAAAEAKQRGEDMAKNVALQKLEEAKEQNRLRKEESAKAEEEARKKAESEAAGKEMARKVAEQKLAEAQAAVEVEETKESTARSTSSGLAKRVIESKLEEQKEATRVENERKRQQLSQQSERPQKPSSDGGVNPGVMALGAAIVVALAATAFFFMK